MNRPPVTTRLPIPNNYDDYVQRLADQLDSEGLIGIDGRAAVLIAALNLLSEFLNKIPVDTEAEQTLRLRVVAELAEIRELSD